MDNVVTTLIDSPLTPYSSAEKIRAWLNDLEKMPDTPEVREEKKQVLRQLEELIRSN